MPCGPKRNDAHRAGVSRLRLSRACRAERGPRLATRAGGACDQMTRRLALRCAAPRELPGVGGGLRVRWPDQPGLADEFLSRQQHFPGIVRLSQDLVRASVPARDASASAGNLPLVVQVVQAMVGQGPSKGASRVVGRTIQSPRLEHVLRPEHEIPVQARGGIVLQNDKRRHGYWLCVPLSGVPCDAGRMASPAYSWPRMCWRRVRN